MKTLSRAWNRITLNKIGFSMLLLALALLTCEMLCIEKCGTDFYSMLFKSWTANANPAALAHPNDSSVAFMQAEAYQSAFSPSFYLYE